MQRSFSIIIPAFNEERYIGACLDAIASQTVMPDEVIVVDNNSKDNTVFIARQYPFVKVVTAHKQGIVHARDAGFNAATGSIIGRIDADTLLDSDWVERITDYFQKHASSDAVTGKCYFYDAPLRKTLSACQAVMYSYIQPLIAGTQVLWGSNMALRRDAWQAVRGHGDLQNDIDEDIMLSLRLADAGMRITRSRHITAAVSLRRGNIRPRDIYDYLSSWPCNYQAAGRPIQRWFIAALVPACWVGGVMAGVICQLLRPQVPLAGLRELYASLWRQ